jgi:hypothetical protein
MDTAIVSATILPLVGVALGTVGTLTGQYLATRGESRRHVEQRAAQTRAERKEAILSFLDVVQRVEQVVDARRHGRVGTPDDAATDDLLHSLWLAKKSLELVCSFELASIAHKYTTTIHTLAWSTTLPERSAQQREYRAEFMEGARRELGIQGPRLYRSTKTDSGTARPEVPAI